MNARRRSTESDGSEITRRILRKDLKLGPFVSLVVMRYMTILDPWFYNEKRCVDIGQYARMGLFLLTGLDRKQASEKAAVRSGRAEVAEMLRSLPCFLKEEVCKSDEDNIVNSLSDLGLAPLMPATVQHLLCEYRKAMCSEGRRRRSLQQTSHAAYVELFRSVHDAFIRDRPAINNCTD